MKKQTSLWYSAAGVLLLLAIIVLANFVLGAFNARIDLTDGKVYTLSDGTRQVLSRLEAPVKIRFYFSQGDAGVPLPVKAYARRVEDLLAEFRAASKGKLIIEKFDPQPDSEAEDSASLDGVAAQTLASGDRFYLGLAVSMAERKTAIPTLVMDHERLLEYDLTRAIARTIQTVKPVIGIMSPLPVFGGPGMPMMGIPASGKQFFVSELERDFTIKPVALDTKTIDADIKVLIVVHPRGISQAGQYAIDQFVMRGGKLIAMLDPYAYLDVQPGPSGPQSGSSSSLETLLKSWGLAMDTRMIADMKFLAGRGQGSLPTLLALDGTAYDDKDVATARLAPMLMPFVGALTGKPAEGLKQEVLVHSSQYAQLVDASAGQERGEKALLGFKAAGIEYPIAVRLSGSFKSAFPDGPVTPTATPAATTTPAATSTATTTATAAPTDAVPAHLSQSASSNSLVLIADSDFINDAAAVEAQEIFGQRIVVPANANLAFVQALVEQFAGDAALTSLRSRQSSVRPFTVIREMEARAQQAYLGKIKELEDSLQQTQQKLQALQGAPKPGGGSALLTAEQQAELDQFRLRASETRNALKVVRRDLRADSEAQQFWTKVVNIGLIPALIIILGLALALLRKRKRVTV